MNLRITAMKGSPGWLLYLCICLAAGFGGRALAVWRHHARAQESPAVQKIATGRAVARNGSRKRAGADDEDSAAAAREVTARCTTEALWAAVESGTGLDPEKDAAIAEELLDREGIRAIERCLTLPQSDGFFCMDWTGVLLQALAKRDCAKTAEFYRTLNWGGREQARDYLANELLSVAAKASADEAIAMLDALKGGAPALFLPREFAPGFDFRKVLDHAANEGATEAGSFPSGVLSAWAQRSPLEALDWARAHPGYSATASPETTGTKEALLAMAEASGPERREALLRMPQYFGVEERKEMWRTIGYKEKVDPGMAKIAAQIGPEEAQSYLVQCLLETCRRDEKDPEWSQVPAELREPAMAEVLEKWEKDDPSPTGAQAREHWKAEMEEVSAK